MGSNWLWALHPELYQKGVTSPMATGFLLAVDSVSE
jgi:hypothetical protein